MWLLGTVWLLCPCTFLYVYASKYILHVEFCGCLEKCAFVGGVLCVQYSGHLDLDRTKILPPQTFSHSLIGITVSCFHTAAHCVRINSVYWDYIVKYLWFYCDQNTQILFSTYFKYLAAKYNNLSVEDQNSFFFASVTMPINYSPYSLSPLHALTSAHCYSAPTSISSALLNSTGVKSFSSTPSCVSVF